MYALVVKYLEKLKENKAGMIKENNSVIISRMRDFFDKILFFNSFTVLRKNISMLIIMKGKVKAISLENIARRAEAKAKTKYIYLFLRRPIK
jgi:hypothetical protein